MKFVLPALLFLAAALLWLPGCSKNESESTDQTELSGLFAEYPDEFSEAVRDDQESAFLRPDTGMPSDSIPFRRHITRGTASVSIVFHDADSLHANRWAIITKTVPCSGTITVWPTDSTSMEKSFSDVGVRYAYAEKTDRYRRRRGWEILSVSPIQFRSDGAPTLVDSVHVTSNTGFEHWFRDPAELVQLDSLPTFDHGDSLTFIAYGPGGNIAVLHHRHGRVRLTETAPGVYGGTFVTGDNSGKRHAAVDIVTAATVYDPSAPYASEAWGLGYKHRY